VHPNCNHRFMTRKDLIGKIAQERRLRFKEKRMASKMEKELLEMDEKDDMDIANMFNNINNKDVPEDKS